MTYIRVIYRNKDFDEDHIPSHLLESLIKKNAITHFYRPSEKRWVNVRIDPTRETGRLYGDPDLRAAETIRMQGKAKLEESHEAWSGWLEELWGYLEKAPLRSRSE